MEDKHLQHFGVLGMKWGRRKGSGSGSPSVSAKVRGRRGAKLKSMARRLLGIKELDPETKAIVARSNKVLNNPKSTKKELDQAMRDIGVDPKTGKYGKTRPRYNKSGKDISVNPEKRFGKKKGQSDKDFDKEIADEWKSDPDRNPTKSNLAKRKVSDAISDAQAKRQMAVGLTVVAASAVARHLIVKELTKRADQAIIAKYGPSLAEMIIKGRR